MDHIFGTCLIAEQEFFDKLNIDPDILQAFKKYSKLVSETYLRQIETYSKYRQMNIQTQMSLLDSYDEFFKTMVNSYGEVLSQFNRYFDHFNKK